MPAVMLLLQRPSQAQGSPVRWSGPGTLEVALWGWRDVFVPLPPLWTQELARHSGFPEKQELVWSCSENRPGWGTLRA